jgi:hypothetical protein
MKNVIQKWVAIIQDGEMIVVRYGWRKTPKYYIMEPYTDKYGRLMVRALYGKTKLKHDAGNACLFDTADDALDALHQRHMHAMRMALNRVEEEQDMLDKIDDFEVSSLTQS